MIVDPPGMSRSRLKRLPKDKQLENNRAATWHEWAKSHTAGKRHRDKFETGLQPGGQNDLFWRQLDLLLRQLGPGLRAILAIRGGNAVPFAREAQMRWPIRD